jgi:hypothetical protein
MPKDNEVDEKVIPEPLTYGMRRKGETAVIGLIPPKVHGIPPKVAEYLRDYEEVPLYSAATVAELRADRDSWREQAEDRLREWDKLRAEVAEQSARADKWKALHDAVSLAHEVQAKSLTRALDRADAAERRVGELEAALRPLADANFAEFCSEKTERMEPDDSKVSYPEETCHITFGMIRNARKALTGADPT